MVSAEDIHFTVGVLGNVFAFFLLLSPIPTFIDICKKKTVEEYSSIPFLATFLNCMLRVLYALPIVRPHSTLVLTINGLGVHFEIVYLSLFLVYCVDKRKKLKVAVSSLASVVFVAVLAALVLSLAHTTHLRTQVVGIITIVSNTMIYAAPLSVLKLVITTKSVEYMPFFVSLSSFANASVWSVYSIHPFDPYLAVPNGLGSLMGLVQLILYATFYNSTKEQMAARKVREAEMCQVGQAGRVLGQEGPDHVIVYMIK